jgi:MinD superfamily P-loop ATPase
MRIAVASGKGGTGKTTLSVALALAARATGPVQLLDCDVEEPNCHIFLGGAAEASAPVTLPVPKVDAAACTGCGACGEACQFNAIVALKSTALVFPELCHGCGACARSCPAGAIREAPRAVGTVERGTDEGVAWIYGELTVGQSLAPPVIRAVLTEARAAAARPTLQIVDAPPGTSCAMVSAVRTADYAILVTEPTPFGLHDLGLALQTVRTLGRPCGVVVNRATDDERVRRYCDSEGVPILLEIPDDRAVAEAYSRGDPLTAARPALTERLAALLRRLTAEAAA